MNMFFRALLAVCLSVFVWVAPLAHADGGATNAPVPTRDGAYVLAPGDLIRITVYQVQDLTLETRIEDNGSVSYPLLGNVTLKGLTVPEAENKLADSLKSGGFLTAPSVTVTVLQVRGYIVNVLGHVGKAGRYPLESRNMRVSDMLASAGGIDNTGSEIVILSGTRNGKPFRRELLLRNLGGGVSSDDDPVLESGDLIYVPATPVYYIYGEVQKPGSFPLQPGMTLMQALATSGGLTQRGTKRGLTLNRKTDHGVQVIEPQLEDVVRPDDVIYVKEGFL